MLQCCSLRVATRNLVSACLCVFTVTTLCVSLFHPNWFYVTIAPNDRRRSWGNDGILVVGNDGRYEGLSRVPGGVPSYWSREHGAQHRHWLAYYVGIHNWSQSSSSAARFAPWLSPGCAEAHTVFNLQAALVCLTSAAIVSALVQFLLDACDSEGRLASRVRQSAVAAIVCVAFCVACTGVAHRLAGAIALCTAQSFLPFADVVDSNEVSQFSPFLLGVRVSFSMSFYLQAVAGALATLAAGVNLVAPPEPLTSLRYGIPNGRARRHYQRRRRLASLLLLNTSGGVDDDSVDGPEGTLASCGSASPGFGGSQWPPLPPYTP